MEISKPNILHFTVVCIRSDGLALLMHQNIIHHLRPIQALANGLSPFIRNVNQLSVLDMLNNRTSIAQMGLPRVELSLRRNRLTAIAIATDVTPSLTCFRMGRSTRCGSQGAARRRRGGERFWSHLTRGRRRLSAESTPMCGFGWGRVQHAEANGAVEEDSG